MEKLERLTMFFDKVIKTVIILLMIIMSISLFYQLFARSVLRITTIWPDELARFTMIWVVYLGAVIGTRNNTHIRIDLIDNLLPKASKYLEYIYLIVYLVFNLVVLKVGLDSITLVINQRSPNMGISMSIPYLALPISAIFSVIYVVHRILHSIAVKKA